MRRISKVILFLTFPIWIIPLLIGSIITAFKLASKQIESESKKKDIQKNTDVPVNQNCVHNFVWADEKLYTTYPPKRKVRCTKCGFERLHGMEIVPTFTNN